MPPVTEYAFAVFAETPIAEVHMDPAFQSQYQPAALVVIESAPIVGNSLQLRVWSLPISQGRGIYCRRRIHEHTISAKSRCVNRICELKRANVIHNFIAVAKPCLSV